MPDERPLLAIVNTRIEAWNRGSAADFAGFDAPPLRGRRDFAQVQQPLFATATSTSSASSVPTWS